MTIKDSLETAGVRTTSGARELVNHVPSRDADVVARLRSAGAIVLGKTNLSTWAGDLQTDNELFGRTLNPWAHDRSPGGSSGGAAAAVAAGLSAADLGSDLGGSIRQPAANCGVFGLKPSHGIVPLRGHIPGPPGTLAELDVAVIGPIARSAGDLELLLDVIGGPDERVAAAWRLELPRPEIQRIGFSFDDDEYALDPEVRTLLESAADDIGAEQVRLPVRLPDALTLYRQLVSPLDTLGEPADAVERWRLEAAKRRVPPDPASRDALEHWGSELHREWLVANETRARQRAAWAESLGRFDAVLLPVTPVPALPHDANPSVEDRLIRIGGRERPWRHLCPWLWLVGVLHLPAVAAPIGLTASGLPVAVQVVGRFGGDRAAIEVARRVGRYLRPPAYSGAAA